MASPKKPVRGSTTGRPIMALLDLLGRRWTLRVLWELRSDTLTFRQLRERCDAVSPTVLNTRLKDLREAGLAELGDDGYALTALGKELLERLEPLYHWSSEWRAALDAPTRKSGRR